MSSTFLMRLFFSCLLCYCNFWSSDQFTWHFFFKKRPLKFNSPHLPFHQRTYVSFQPQEKSWQINDFFSFFKHCASVRYNKTKLECCWYQSKKVTKSRRGAQKSVILELLDRLAGRSWQNSRSLLKNAGVPKCQLNNRAEIIQQ